MIRILSGITSRAPTASLCRSEPWQVLNSKTCKRRDNAKRMSVLRSFCKRRAMKSSQSHHKPCGQAVLEWRAAMTRKLHSSQKRSPGHCSCSAQLHVELPRFLVKCRVEILDIPSLAFRLHAKRLPHHGYIPYRIPLDIAPPPPPPQNKEKSMALFAGLGEGTWEEHQTFKCMISFGACRS